MKTGELRWIQYPTIGYREKIPNRVKAGNDVSITGGEPVIVLEVVGTGGFESGECSYVLTSQGPMWIQNWNMYRRVIKREALRTL